jgi:hypothetical protein
MLDYTKRVEIVPDVDQVCADFRELNELSGGFNFDLAGALDSLAESLTSCDVDFSAAPRTGYAVARYKLTERLQSALATLRIFARDSDGHLG